MKGLLIILLVFASKISFAQEGGEGLALSPGFSYFSDEDRGGNPSSVSKESGTMVDLRFGYHLSANVSVGVNYMSNNYRVEGASSSSESSVTGLGPQIGYFMGGLHLLFTYYMQSELQPSPTLRYRGGTGTQFDLGYRWIFGSVGFGPYLSIRNLTYSEQQTNGVTVIMTDQRKWNRVYPGLALWLLF
ncbi:MAG: hypothetical protein K2X47_03310 [Bdellovibrionales bacterium]|nr:hypothetical protein [Bdellovibrionales bacterium]